MATVIATTAAHCDPPPAPVLGSATLQVLNGPVVTAGDTLHLRAELNEATAPQALTLYFGGPNSGTFVDWYDFPADECGGIDHVQIPQTDPSTDFSVDLECVLPAWVENGTWRVWVVFNNGYGTDTSFEVTGGFDDPSGPTVQFTQLPTQPVVAGESFEVVARITDPNGIALSATSLQFTSGTGTRPECQQISTIPYPSFDIEVRYRCTTRTTSVGARIAQLDAFDLLWRSSSTRSLPVTIV